MKKAISAILACVLLMSVFTMLFIFNAQAESSSTTTYFVNKGDNWEYICTEIGADEDYVAAPDGWLDKTDTAGLKDRLLLPVPGIPAALQTPSFLTVGSLCFCARPLRLKMQQHSLISS